MPLKKILFSICLTLVVFSTHGQNFMPYNIDSNGLTMKAIVSKMYENANPNDTDEGGELTRIAAVNAYWQGRVHKNDSGQGINNNMFSQYFHTLKIGTENSRSLSCSNGNWQCIGPDDMSAQTTAYAQCVWASAAD